MFSGYTWNVKMFENCGYIYWKHSSSSKSTVCINCRYCHQMCTLTITRSDVWTLWFCMIDGNSAEHFSPNETDGVRPYKIDLIHDTQVCLFQNSLQLGHGDLLCETPTIDPTELAGRCHPLSAELNLLTHFSAQFLWNFLCKLIGVVADDRCASGDQLYVWKQCV